MSTAMTMMVAAAGLCVLAALAWYARRLWREVRRREAFSRDEAIRANRNCVDSLEAIAKAMVDEQIDPVEGALRCRVLLDIIDTRLVQQEPLSVFATVQERAAHLKTHQARNALSPRQRHREDQAREAIAHEHAQSLKNGAAELGRLCREWRERGVYEQGFTLQTGA
ncbi:DUF2489 domain-containing protein [Salinicola aestuarinus]|uniref:DUF2489 domain-containing protein n=1 Tax=Salinicola aestuarinus TaxID=1949082 RepID=UPI000DA1945B|nr:DUF2489 domain-containing protein [Salinicola aestuarinus]